MTPEQLLILHSTTPSKTSNHLSKLPQRVLSALFSSLHKHPNLVKPLWSYPPLRTSLLSVTPPPETLIHHLQTLSHASQPSKTTLRVITTSATTALRAHNFVLLLPLLQALGNLPGSAASTVRANLLKVFLARAPPDPKLIPSLLESSFHHHEIRFVVAYISRTVACTQNHAELLTTLLSSSLPLAKPLMQILSAPQNTTLIALEACLLDDITLAPYLSNIITRTIFASAAPVTTPLLQCLFILLSRGDERTQDHISDSLSRMLQSTAISFSPPAEGSSGNDPRTAVFINAVRKIPSGCEQDVTDFLESLLWKSCRYVAVTLLEEVFIWHPNSRTRILKAIITGLSTSASNVVHNAFMYLFKNLVLHPTTSVAMRSCNDVLKEALDYVFIMPIGLDAIFVEYLARVLATIPSGQDRIMMFLRKVAGAKAIREQRIACRGLIAVLSIEAGDSLHNNACDILVMLIEADVCEYLMGLLLETVERSSMSVDRIENVVKATTERIRVVTGNDGMDICRFFEQVDGEYALRDPVPLMLRFCIETKGVSGPFLGNFVKYLCDEQGAIKHACSAERSPVSVAQRMKLLCSLLETVLGLSASGGEESVLHVYGVAIVLRNLLATPRGIDDNGNQPLRLGKEEDDYLTMRQAAAANHVGGSLSNWKEGEVLGLLALRIQALSTVDKIGACRIPALINLVRSEIFVHVETDIRSVVGLKEVTISSTHVDNILSLIRKLFMLSSPWTPLERCAKGSDITQDQKNIDSSAIRPKRPLNDGTLGFVFALGLDKESLIAFEKSNLVKLQEDTRIRMRQSSLSILCVLLSRQLVENDMAFLMSLMNDETAIEDIVNKTNDDSSQANPNRPTPTSLCGDSREDERVLVVARLTNLFHREFANSLSISLTLSYLSVLGHLLSKECKRSKDTKKVRKLVSNALTSLLREYAIRHQSVMRSILKLLTNTFEPAAGIDFAKSVLVWLGNSPCLLNSKFVEADEGSELKLGVDEFDRDILEEAIALDAGEESEDEETSDFLKNDNSLGEPINNVIGNSTSQDDGHNDCLESTPRMTSDNADPVKSLCLDETSEVALLSVTSMLELCELMLQRDTQRYREALRNASGNTLVAEDFVAERICDVVRVFYSTPFMQSYNSKSQTIPALLLKRLSRIVHKFLEISQLVLQLLLKMFRNRAKAIMSKLHVQAVGSILNILYSTDGSEAILSAVLESERRSNRSSLQEGINVSAAELFRYTSSKECNLDYATRETVLNLRKILKSRKNRIPHVHSVKTPWTQSSGSSEPVSDDCFRVSRPQKKQRLRSRNPDVDEWLREENDGDNYADLEDFVVAMDADQL